MRRQPLSACQRNLRPSLCHRESFFYRSSITMLPQRPRKALRNPSGTGSPVTPCVTSAVVFLMKKTAHNKYVLKYVRLCVLFVPLKTPSSSGGTRPTPSRRAGPVQAAGASVVPGPTHGDSVPSSVHSQFWMPATLSRCERENKIRRNKHPFSVCLSETFS